MNPEAPPHLNLGRGNVWKEADHGFGKIRKTAFPTTQFRLSETSAETKQLTNELNDWMGVAQALQEITRNVHGNGACVKVAHENVLPITCWLGIQINTYLNKLSMMYL